MVDRFSESRNLVSIGILTVVEKRAQLRVKAGALIGQGQ